MSFPRYPSYKDSSVEWLGEVPGHWDVIRLKNVLQRRITDGPHTTPEFVDDGVPFLSVDGIQDGELKFDGCRYIQEADHEEYRKKALPQKDDLLMGKAASTGKIARVKVDFEFSIWSPLALIRLDPTDSNPAFYEQSLKSPIVQAQIDNLCTANTQKNISMDDIPKLILTRPPLPEQIQIAAFLDRETAKIDELVAEQRRLTELLKEKRQAVISHAVTQGLNPDAPMKPSGIEWLGDVPEHWRVVPLRWAAKCCSGDGLSSTEVESFSDDEHTVRVIGGNGLMGYTDQKNVDHSLLAVGRVGALCGNVHLVNPPAWITDNALVLDPDSSIFDLQFLSMTLRSRNLNDIASKTAQPLITGTQVSDQRIPCPPLPEQEAIAVRLTEESAKFDTLTAEAQRAIDLLQERRTALISAAVTGQIDVRGVCV